MWTAATEQSHGLRCQAIVTLVCEALHGTRHTNESSSAWRGLQEIYGGMPRMKQDASAYSPLPLHVVGANPGE